MIDSRHASWSCIDKIAQRPSLTPGEKLLRPIRQADFDFGPAHLSTADPRPASVAIKSAWPEGTGKRELINRPALVAGLCTTGARQSNRGRPESAWSFRSILVCLFTI
jgi:hypothetical protein